MALGVGVLLEALGESVVLAALGELVLLAALGESVLAALGVLAGVASGAGRVGVVGGIGAVNCFPLRWSFAMAAEDEVGSDGRDGRMRAVGRRKALLAVAVMARQKQVGGVGKAVEGGCRQS